MHDPTSSWTRGSCERPGIHVPLFGRPGSVTWASPSRATAPSAARAGPSVRGASALASISSRWRPVGRPPGSSSPVTPSWPSTGTPSPPRRARAAWRTWRRATTSPSRSDGMVGTPRWSYALISWSWDPRALGAYAVPVRAPSSGPPPSPGVAGSARHTGTRADHAYLLPPGRVGLALACRRCGWERNAGDPFPRWHSIQPPVVYSVEPGAARPREPAFARGMCSWRWPTWTSLREAPVRRWAPPHPASDSL